MNILSLHKDSDTLGIIASTLCFIHCLATPIIFMVPASSLMTSEHISSWWGYLDVIFLGISFIAVYWSSKTTLKLHIKYIFWMLWFALMAIVINEKLEFISLPEFVIYPITLSLVVLHFYNRKYCGCRGEKCCTN